LEGGTLFISRNSLVFSWLKSVFDDCGFKDVILSTADNDGLTLLINQLKPKYIFMHSEFYSGGTPYQIGSLIAKMPELNIIVVNFGNIPDSFAVRYIFHGAKSYLDVNYGIDEFIKGLRKIKTGDNYYSQGVEMYIKDKIDDKPELKREITIREWQVLFLICNGFKREQIVVNLSISIKTVANHINNLFKVLDVENRFDLLRRAIYMGWVKKEHLIFQGTDIKIPQHPTKKTNKKNTPAHGGGLKAMRLVVG